MDMKSITQKLQDDIRAILEGNIKHPNQQNIDVHEPEKDEITSDDFKKLRAMKKTKDGKVHNCATHVEHAVLGKGVTVSEQHAEPDENGNIEWYTVQFEHSTQQVLTKDLTITMSETHVHESADEQVDEAMSHQAKTTMKHIPNASPALKKAAKDIKPGIGGYADRVAMLKAGGVKEEVEIVYEANIQPTAAKSRSHIGGLSHPTTNHVVHASSGKEIGLITKQHDGKYYAHPSSVKLSHNRGGVFDTKDQAHQHIRDAHAKAIKTGTLSDRWKKQAKLPQFAKEETQIDELSVNTLNKVHRAAVKDANDFSRDGDEARADKRNNLAGKASYKAELKNRAAGLKPSGQHALESVEAKEYTFAEYLDAARTQYGDEEAVNIANEAFKNKDITLFIDQSQSPEA